MFIFKKRQLLWALALLTIVCSVTAYGNNSSLAYTLDAACAESRPQRCGTTVNSRCWQALLRQAFACSSLTGCGKTYDLDKQDEIELLQVKVNLTSALGTMIVANQTLADHDHGVDGDGWLTLIPASVHIASLVWAVTSKFEDKSQTQAPLPTLRKPLAHTSDTELRAYLRENLTPANYRHIIADLDPHWFAASAASKYE